MRPQTVISHHRSFAVIMSNVKALKTFNSSTPWLAVQYGNGTLQLESLWRHGTWSWRVTSTARVVITCSLWMDYMLMHLTGLVIKARRCRWLGSCRWVESTTFLFILETLQTNSTHSLFPYALPMITESPLSLLCNSIHPPNLLHPVTSSWHLWLAVPF